MELENIILHKLARSREPKATSLLSYMEHRSNTNISNIMKKRSCYGEVTIGRGRVKEGSQEGEYG
jgi:hypothetical protein